MSDYLLCMGARFVSGVFCLLPPGIALGIARILGGISYFIFARRARTAYLNLKLAFGNKFSIQERKRIIKELFRNLMMNFIEILRFPKIDKAYINKYVKIEGKERIEAALKRGKGLIFLTAHFGNWELLSLAGSAFGSQMVVLAREQRYPRLNSLLNTYRMRLGAKVITRGKTMRGLLESLRDNKAVGILGDQKAGKTGVLVNFFNRLAYTPTGMLSLAGHTGAVILPVFMIREKGPLHRIEIKDPLEVDRDRAELVLKKFNQILENYIRGYPSQWFWLHRRWKASPNRNILILSDGKTGHANQARAVAEIIRQVIQEKVQGLRCKVQGDIVEVQELEVKFKNKFTKRLINLFGFCASRNCVGCLRCLEFCLEEDLFEKVSSFYADIVISCGSNLAPLNLILTKGNQAKSIVVMRPSIFPIKKFDLVIVPAHDRIKPTNNVVITQGALNLIDREYITEQAEKLKTQLPITNYQLPRMGVLIGGDSKNYTLTREIVSTVIEQLLGVAQELDAQLLVTTSRRSSKELDNLVKERLGKNEKCKLLVIANEKNIEGVVAGILGLSDIVIVSGESISMVSEALNSAKPVIVFEAAQKGPIKKSKHKLFLNNLARQNYLSLIRPEELSKEIKKVYQEPQKIKPLEDKRWVYEAIKKIF